MAAVSWQSLAVGTFCAAVSGLLSVRGMLRCMRGARLWPFAVYLALLALLLIVWQIFF